MREDLPNDGGIVQRGDQPQPAPAVRACQDVDSKRPVHQRRPAPAARRAAKLEALFAAQRGAFRVVVPLRNDKVSTKSAGVETVREGLSVAEITERIRSQVVGRDGIEPPTPGFSVLCSTN